ncbi:MAG: alpha/beta fold hydrolase [Polyangiaceae bacterium]|nr:alpha/beta fold hydrolase [Polyangiaceae bacterium]
MEATVIWGEPPPSKKKIGAALRGHQMTLTPFIWRKLRPLPRPTTERWKTELIDPKVGPVELTGRLLRQDGSDRGEPLRAGVVVVVHGLGGSAASGYMALALRACERAGKNCLLLNLRGADLRGQDFNHAGLVDDIDAAVDSYELKQAPSVDLFGYSLGGHLSLAYGCRAPSPRLRRIAAICSPLLLDQSAATFDAPKWSVYRRHVMESLHGIYSVAYQRNPAGLSPIEARKIHHIREWDERIVAPRYGFSGADEYYRKVSVGFQLDELKREALYVGAPFEPMIQPNSVYPALQKTDSPRLHTAWDTDAGHLGFSARFSLGIAGELGMEEQVIAWLSLPTQG